MARALKVCSVAGCPNLVRSGRCDSCDAEADRRRGTAAERGYDHRWRTRIAPAFLRAHPFCVCTEQDCHGHEGRCLAPATVPDHYPLSRRELVRMRVRDVDAHHRLRSLCDRCHNKHTAVTSPGGWHQGGPGRQ